MQGQQQHQEQQQQQRRTTSTATSSSSSSYSERDIIKRSVDKWMNNFDKKMNYSLQDKIGQMSQIDIAMLLTEDRMRLNETLVELWIGRQGIGSVLNTPNIDGSYWTSEMYRNASNFIQDIAIKYNRPLVIWGLDSVHGANYVRGATITPQPINIGASFNTTCAKQAGQIAAYDTAQAGINWVFSPLVGIAIQPKWSRVYETYGEDPVVVGEMALNTIDGIESVGDDSSSHPTKVAACAKHFVGYSDPRNGHDRAPSWIPTRHLYQYFVPPWRKVISDGHGVQTIMESYTEYDGVPNVVNRQTLTRLLRHELGWKDGVLVTDYKEIRNLSKDKWHHITSNTSNAILKSLQQTTIDISMIPLEATEFYESVTNGVKNNHILSIERIDTSVRRVLQLKAKLGLLPSDPSSKSNSSPDLKDDEEEKDEKNNDNDTKQQHHRHELQHQNQASEMARQSIVMAKNDGGSVLPISTSTSSTAESSTSSTTTTNNTKILVTGPTSTSLSYMSGGWTGLWQGVPLEDEELFFGSGSSAASSTVLEALTSNPNLDVSYSCGVDIAGRDCQDNDPTAVDGNTVLDQVKDFVRLGGSNKEFSAPSIGRAVNAAAAASNVDYVIVCIGEEPYTEKPGDVRSLYLPQGQYELVRSIKESKSTNAKIIVVYFGGRPRLLHDIAEYADAILLAFLPGPAGGQAVADILTGQTNPSAKLPMTWPKYDGDTGGIPYYHAVSDQCTKGDGILPHYEYTSCDVEYEFGHGLSYTNFQYSDLKASGGIDTDLTVSVNIQNVGHTAGADVVMFFTFDEYRSVTPEYKRLRYFEKVHLKPGHSTAIKATIPLDELKFVGPNDDKHFIIDPDMISWLGVGPKTDCSLDNSTCVKLQSENPNANNYVGACDAACKVWERSGCSRNVLGGNCLDMCTSISQYPNTPMDHSNDGWGWDYVRCIENVVFGVSSTTTNKKGPEDLCWKMISLCRDVTSTGQLDEFGIGNSGSSHYHHSSRQGGGGAIPVDNIVALIVALIAIGIMVHLMNSGKLKFRRRNGGDDDNDRLLLFYESHIVPLASLPSRTIHKKHS